MDQKYHTFWVFFCASKFNQTQIEILLYIAYIWAFFFLFHEQYSLRTIYIVEGVMNNLGRRMRLDYRQALPHFYVEPEHIWSWLVIGLVLIPWDMQGQPNSYRNTH